MEEFKVQKEDFEIDSLHNLLKHEDAGCVIHFVGTVRGTSQGKKVISMEIEAYEEMVVPIMREMANEAKAAFGLTGVVMVHRKGALAVDDNIVFMGVSAPHRKQGFKAMVWLMDELKQRLPLWKKEVYLDGSEWVEGESRPAGRNKPTATRKDESRPIGRDKPTATRKDESRPTGRNKPTATQEDERDV